MPVAHLSGFDCSFTTNWMCHFQMTGMTLDSQGQCVHPYSGKNSYLHGLAWRAKLDLKANNLANNRHFENTSLMILQRDEAYAEVKINFL